MRLQGLCRTRPRLSRDRAARSGAGRSQHGDFHQSEPSGRVLLARPGLSAQGRRRTRDRGFLAGDRPDRPQTDRASYLARAQLFTAKGDYPRAIADFDKLLSVAPDDKAVQQQRQSAIAMQTELARVHEGQQPAAPSQGLVQAPVQGQVAASPAPQTTVPGTTSPSAAPLIGRAGSSWRNADMPRRLRASTGSWPPIRATKLRCDCVSHGVVRIEPLRGKQGGHG